MVAICSWKPLTIALPLSYQPSPSPSQETLFFAFILFLLVRGKHGSDATEDDASRRSARGKEKGHGHSERAGSSAGHHRSSPPLDTTGKPRSRREGGTGSHDNKKHKEDDPKTPSELGHKRKREHLEDAHLPEVKRARHGNTSRDVDRHHGNTGKDSEHLYGSVDRKWRPDSSASEVSARKQHRSRSPRTPVPSEKDRERGRVGKSHKHTDKEGKRTASSEKEQSRTSEGAGRSRTLNWAAVNNFTKKANSKLNYRSSKATMEKFTPAAVFANIEVSPSLAGHKRFQKIMELVRSHLKVSSDRGNIQGYWTDVLERSELLTPRTHVRSASDWDKAVSNSLGACRRAMTASDDYSLRRLLRKDQHEVRG